MPRATSDFSGPGWYGLRPARISLSVATGEKASCPSRLPGDGRLAANSRPRRKLDSPIAIPATGVMTRSFSDGTSTYSTTYSQTAEARKVAVYEAPKLSPLPRATW